MTNFIKRVIIFLCVLYAMGRIYFFVWTKSFKILSIIQTANLEPLDISIISWSVYIILAVIAVALVAFIIWLFVPQQQKHEE